MAMLRSQIDPMPKFFDRYIQLVDDIDLLQGLVVSSEDFQTYDFGPLEVLGDRVYAPDKWTIKDILQHLIDNERIQAYRALRFARYDPTVLPGYDEQWLAAHAKATQRSLKELRDEFICVRNCTVALFKSFDQEMLLQKGIAFQIEVTPLALGFQIIGHQIHHFNIIKERYLPLLDGNV
jgi:hypothetical protein